MIIVFSVGALLGVGSFSSFLPDPKNPPPLALVPIAIFGTLFFAGIAMILGSDIDNTDPQDRILIGRPVTPIVERESK